MLLPRYNTKLFSDIFPEYSDFKNCFDNDFDSYAKDIIKSTSLQTLYYLLYARYGNNPIVNKTEDIFKAKIVAITFQKGPTWERRLEIQKSLRELTEAELLTGAKTILNKALHPETEPDTQYLEELTYINSQDVSNQKRSKIDAYAYLYDVLRLDVTEEFIQSYAKLFSKFVSPTISRIYVNDIEEEENDE